MTTTTTDLQSRARKEAFDEVELCRKAGRDDLAGYLEQVDQLIEAGDVRAANALPMRGES